MDNNAPRIIARGEWEQDENGDLLYIPRHKAPPLGDARGNIGPRQEGRDPDNLPVDEYIPGPPPPPEVAAMMAEIREEAARERARERGGYRCASNDTWAAAQKAYLAGETADAVCERYDLRIGTFRYRARQGGWRRSDQNDPAPMDWPLDPDDAAADPADYADMAHDALLRMDRAVQAGRAIEATRWMRLHARLLDLAARPRTPAGSPPLCAPQPAPQPEPKPEKAPDPLDRAMALARTVEAIARDAAALSPDDADGLAALQARVDALDEMRAPGAAISHYSDGSHPENFIAESETPP